MKVHPGPPRWDPRTVEGSLLSLEEVRNIALHASPAHRTSYPSQHLGCSCCPGSFNFISPQNFSEHEKWNVSSTKNGNCTCSDNKFALTPVWPWYDCSKTLSLFLAVLCTEGPTQNECGRSVYYSGSSFALCLSSFQVCNFTTGIFKLLSINVLRILWNLKSSTRGHCAPLQIHKLSEFLTDARSSRDSTFSYVGPATWSSLPFAVRHAQTLPSQHLPFLSILVVWPVLVLFICCPDVTFRVDWA